MSAAKISVAKKAIKYIESKISKETVLGIGTGSTVSLKNIILTIEEMLKMYFSFKKN